MNLVLKSTLTAAVALLSTATMAQQVVKIGHVGPISGAIAHLGKDNENGARLAIEELNAKGVKIGNQTVKFELITEGDGADPKQGTAAAQKLVDSKVNGVVGHLNSGTSIPASKIYSEAGIPQICPSAIDVMVRSGSADPAKYLGTLAKTTNYKGVTGTIGFDEKGDIKNGALTLYTYKGAKRDAIAVVR